MSTAVELAIEPPKKMPANLHRDKLLDIGNLVMEGLSEEEACVLAGFPPKLFKEIRTTNEGVALFLEKKKIEFKRHHLRNVSAKQNDKNSMWLLENLRPEEFGKKKPGGEGTGNLIGAIIKEIRQNSAVLPVKIHEGTYTTKDAEGRELDPRSVLG
jgi:hypothetical protein